MKVVVDDKIPYLQTPLRSIVEEVVALPASDITPEVVRDADAIIVRTRTQIGKPLLEGSRVRFVATATIGYDHIDTAYCLSHGVAWTNAPGCNASSVCQYVECALRLMEREGFISLAGSTLGIVGVGHVGSRVKSMAERLGMRVLCCDPPLQEAAGQEGVSEFVPLSQLDERCDVITFHVPLTSVGPYATYHLADAAFFASLERKPLFINTSRGAVTDTQALKQALLSGQIRQAVIDVWEGEPNVDLELLRMARITTPHIAGYSADGKARASQMSLDALCRFFSLPRVSAEQPPLAKQPYDIDADSRRLKAAPASFEYLRNHYPIRRE